MITSSYSGIMMYENCPSSYKRRYVTKEAVPVGEIDPSSPRGRGLRLHNEIENYLNGEQSLSHEMLRFREFLDALLEHDTQPEVQWSFDREWNEVPFEDKENGMLRGILDCITRRSHVVEVYEWKTGREYPDHASQRVLYGLAALLLHPGVDKCIVTTLYLDSGNKPLTELTRDQMMSYKWIWERKVNQCQPPQPYHMRPNWKCKFCDFSRRNGGKCPN